MSSEVIVVIVGVVVAAGGLLFLELKSRGTKPQPNRDIQPGDED